MSGTGKKPLVVKVGGSLLSRRQNLVSVLQGSERPLLIIPGGGIFADMVRNSGAGDEASHWMAIAAMEQYGWLLSMYGIPVTAQLEVPKRTAIFLPYARLWEADPLPHSWDITSDSIAAWIAGHLHLDLLLLKSIDGIIVDGVLQDRVTGIVKTDVVDPFFLPFILEKGIRTTILNGSDPSRVQDFLRGLPVLGTTIGTTF